MGFGAFVFGGEDLSQRASMPTAQQFPGVTFAVGIRALSPNPNLMTFPENRSQQRAAKSVQKPRLPVSAVCQAATLRV